MEIKTCEQYVLAELDYEQRRNGRLEAENNRLAKRLDAMTKRAKSYKETIDRPMTPIEALADRVMREEMLVRFSYANVTGVRNSLTGQVLGFDEWCRNAMRLRRVPSDISDEEIIEFMRADLKAVYDEKAAALSESGGGR